MKKILALALAMFLLVTSAYAAAPDLTSYSFEELLEIQRLLTAEIMSRDEWKEVAVPAGTYTVGVDIPAGAYTVEVREGGTPVQVYEEKDGKARILTQLTAADENRKQIKKLDLEDGNVIIIVANVVYFMPYTGLGF